MTTIESDELEPVEMSFLADLATLTEITEEATVSRTVMTPVLLQVLDGNLTVSAGGRSVDLRPGGVVHLPARLPHAVIALEPSRLLLTMLDPRAG